MTLSEDTRRVVVYVPNWLGDSIMAMPALQLLASLAPWLEIGVVAKPSVKALWELHSTAARIHVLSPGLGGIRALSEELAHFDYQRAFLLPHSLRVGLSSWLARIPVRRGLAIRGRSLFLTERLVLPSALQKRHQSEEYAYVLGVDPSELPWPSLTIPSKATEFAQSRVLGAPHPRIALLPGAQRGPSKQWPKERFIEVSRAIVQQGGSSLILGAKNEAELCSEIALASGEGSASLAGQTNLHELAALLSMVDAVVANDSGGMHLAAALGAPVVALFGTTNPDQTGPLGSRAVVLQKSDYRSKEIPRHSPRAEEALKRIEVSEVTDALFTILKTTPVGI